MGPVIAADRSGAATTGRQAQPRIRPPALLHPIERDYAAAALLRVAALLLFGRDAAANWALSVGMSLPVPVPAVVTPRVVFGPLH
jgi:hypothetical protein